MGMDNATCDRCRRSLDPVHGFTPSERVDGVCEICAYELTGVSETDED